MYKHETSLILSFPDRDIEHLDIRFLDGFIWSTEQKKKKKKKQRSIRVKKFPICVGTKRGVVILSASDICWNTKHQKNLKVILNSDSKLIYYYLNFFKSFFKSAVNYLLEINK